MDVLPYALMLVGCVVVFVILFRFADRILPKDREEEQQDSSSDDTTTRPCPLCGSSLKDGERVHSVVYPGKPDQLTDIFGCPYCYADHPKKASSDQQNVLRMCPVCKRGLDSKDYLIGRLFITKKKNHLHVLGCTKCRGPNSRQ